MKAQASDVERDAIREALLAIVDTNNGILNPHQVLEVARDATHVLHRYFEWDDGAAAEAYRVAQVGALVRRVRLTIVRREANARAITISTTRGFQSRPSMRTSEGGYEAIDAILADSDKRHELLAQVTRELSAYRKRWAELSELDAVWSAIDEAAEDVAQSSSPAPGDESRPGAAG